MSKPLLAATVTLTEAQIEFYRTNGFLTIDAITTPEEVVMLREVYDRMFAERRGRDDGNQFDLGGTDEEGVTASLPQILNPSRYEPAFLTTLIRVNALAICRQLLGDEAEFGGEHAIMKPAKHGAATPWHQDEAYWSSDMDYNSLSVWVPLQDVSEANGCLHFIPGTQKWEVVEHQSINNDPRIHGLEVVPGTLDTSAAVACPIPAGGATFHGGRMMHYAQGNASDEPRRALISGVAIPATKRKTPRRFPWNEAKTTARTERANQAQEKESATM